MMLSVVIPLHNNAKTIGRCLEPFAAKAGAEECEVVVVDDGSVDGGGDLVPGWARLLRQEHGGAAAARNCGLAAASGDYVWFVDADDFVVAEGVELLIRRTDSHPVADMLKMGNLCDAHGRSLGLYSTLDHTTYLYRREFLDAHNLRYPCDMALLEDSLFVVRCLSCDPVVEEHPEWTFYRLGRRHNSTAGGWPPSVAARYLPSINTFFFSLREYVEDKDTASARRLYDRYLYVYLRVLAVKGCLWFQIRDFRRSAAVPGTFYYGPADTKMRLLSKPAVHRLFLAGCRLFRIFM